MTQEADDLLAALAEAVDTRVRGTEDRDALIRRGDEIGIPKTTLAETARLSRRAVYDILGKPEPDWSVEPPAGTCIEVDKDRVFRRDDHHPDFHWRDGSGWYRWREVQGHARRGNGRLVDTAPWASLPSQSTDPTPKNPEREVDGILRAAANLAMAEHPGAVGEELRNLFWTYYNTPDYGRVLDLARAILTEHPAGRTGLPQASSTAEMFANGVNEMRRQAKVAGKLLGETIVRLHKQAGRSAEKA